MDLIPWWWGLLLLMLGACIGAATVAVVVYGATDDAYDAGYRAGTDWADLEDARER